MQIIPAVLTSDKQELNETIQNLSFTKVIQIDFMDGLFTDTKSAQLSEVELVKGKFFEAHLMVESPEQKFELIKKKGFKRVICHVETIQDLSKTIKEAENLGLELCLAFNPTTPPIITKGVNRYLFLTVIPGRQGQKLIEKAIPQILNFKKRNPNLVVGVDGGITADNIKLFKTLDYVCVGSFITKSKDLKKSYDKLKLESGS